MSNRGTVILLCNLTTSMSKPWTDAGYRVVMIDPQHPASFVSGDRVERIAGTLIDGADRLSWIIRTENVVFVAGFPPCTDVALCGTKHWAKKREADPYFQAKAAIVAEQCRMIGMLSGAPWFFENPRSAFSKIFGPPSHKFDPYRFTRYCANDNYTKDTWLWAGNGFVMPEFARDEALGEPDDRIHKCPPGPDRANIRSATPRGFAMAVYLANAPHLKADNDNMPAQRTEVAV